MKRKSYYFLFVLYILMLGFILYINGVFTGEIGSISNFAINLTFFILIGILMIISAVFFNRLNRAGDALERVAKSMSTQYEVSSVNLWSQYKEKENVFEDSVLDAQFAKYQRRIKAHTTKKGTVTSACSVEEYINEDLLDQIAGTHYNSVVSGTMSGLGILGTFLGLTLGMLSFTGNDIFTISDNIAPLLSGMKVAFHTSVYGIFFSLVFNFVYRGIMADAYTRLTGFLETFHECTEPPVSQVDENMNAMLIYQANMANSMKSIMELMKYNEESQIKGLDKIVQQFMNQLSESLGTEFDSLGRNLKDSCEAQSTYARNFQRLEESTRLLLDASHAMQDSMQLSLERQQHVEEKLNRACENLGNELYTFHQMRDLYEK